MKRILLLFTMLFLLLPLGLEAQTRVYYYQIDEEIAKPALRKTEMAVAYAVQHHFDVIFLEMNTFGGELESADKIRTLLMDAPITTMVFINNNAASAGALISLACDSIYMAAGSSMGAASVVNESGEVLPDKYQSYMRSLMRATAEKNHRNPNIAEAMVDPDVYVPEISEKGKVLTLTPQEALAYGFCEGEVDSFESALAQAGITDYTLQRQTLSWLDKLILILVNPAVSGILIMLIAGGIYMELQSPGVGFPLIVALSAAALYFAPHYLQGLAAHWEIALFVIGLLLLIAEFFFIPGFGVLGIMGISAMVTALVLTMVFNVGFDFTFTPSEVIISNILLVMTALIVGFFFSLWLSKKLFTSNTPFGALALSTTLAEQDGFVSGEATKMQALVGKCATTQTFMRPAGKIEVDGEWYDAVSESGVIEKGMQVKIVRFENAQFIVTTI